MIKSFSTFVQKKLTESPLNNAQLNKVFVTKKQSDDQVLRGTKFLEKYANSEPFKIVGRKEDVTLKVDDDILKQLEAMKKAGEEGAPNPWNLSKFKFETTDGEFLKISQFEKTAEFGASAGTGGGSAQTELMEALQCWYCAAAYLDPPLDSFEELQAQLEQCKPIVKGTVVDPTHQQDKKWENSLINTANLVAHTLKLKSKEYEFHHQSNVVNHITTVLFGIANKNEKIATGAPGFASKDKWNPADIWVFKKDSINEILSFKPADLTFEQLNEKMLDWFHGHEAIGISLKKLTDYGHFQVLNQKSTSTLVKKQAEYISIGSGTGQSKKNPKSALTSSSSVNMLIEVGRSQFTINWRTFQSNTTSWNGEVLGNGARGGKISGKIAQTKLDQAFKELGVEGDHDLGVVEARNMSRDDMIEEIFELNRTVLKWPAKSKEEDLNTFAEIHSYKIYSKLMGMRLAAILERYPAVRDKFADLCFDHAFSTHQYSSVYAKVSSFDHD